MRIRTRAAVICARFTAWLIKKLNKGGGGAFPGLVARIIDPDILSSMASQIKNKSVAVLGTNGKTTTNALIYKALCDKGCKVVTNATGANMYNGIVSAFVLAAGKGGRIDADFACIEVDEIAAANILPKLHPYCALLTNISTDQTDRMGNMDMTAAAIKSAFDSVPGAVLILNADEPLSGALAYSCKNPSMTFGVNGQAFENISKPPVEENAFCPLCGSKLRYDSRHYGLLGDYGCPSCGFRRAVPDFTADSVVYDSEAYDFTLGPDNIHCHVKAAYNIYNTLSAYAALNVLEAGADRFCESVKAFDYGNNREKTYIIGGKAFKVHLAKNPEGFRQKLSIILNDKNPKDIVILINDRPADGEDISWIWDVNFQYLKYANPASITVTGTRYCDAGLRFKYEGMDFKTARDVKAALCALLKEGTDNIYVVVNYSGLMPVNNILKIMRQEEAEGQK